MMAEARKMGFKTLYTMHNAYAWMSPDEIRGYSEILASAGKVVPVSSFVERYYLARTGASPGKIQTVMNGVDFSELDMEYDDFSITREKLGVAETDVIVAEIASFHPTKHQVGMIGVMERLQKDHPEIKLLLVGNEGDAGYHSYFTRALANSPAKENIVVIPYFDHKYMGQFLRDVVDIFTLPTLYEGCSNAVLEAAYCAKPMVLTNVGNAGDIKDAAACEIVQTAYEDLKTLSEEDILSIALQKNNRNTDELAAAILKISSDIDAYQAKAGEVRERSGQYDVSHMIGRYVDIIEAL